MDCGAPYLRLVADAPSAPPWELARQLSLLQAAQRRLAWAVADDAGAVALVPDLVEEVAARIRGLAAGLSGVLQLANADRYKAIFVSDMRADRVPDATRDPWYAGSRSIAKVSRPYGGLTKWEQVCRLRLLLSHCTTRRHLAQACHMAGMDRATFVRIMEAVRVPVRGAREA
jgi:hypothetical protein